MFVKVTSKRQSPSRRGCWTRWEWAPATRASSTRRRAVSYFDRGPSTPLGSERCVARSLPVIHRSIWNRSAASSMTRRYGIDTSVLVRLITADPETAFTHCVSRLSALIQEEGAEIFASNQVISEAYVAVRHHYGVTGADARAALLDTLRSGRSPLSTDAPSSRRWRRPAALASSTDSLPMTTHVQV